MRRAWAAAAVVVLALALAGCGDDEDSDGSDAPEQSGLEADADALVACLGEADVDAEINPNTAFGVESEHVGVEATDLPSELLLFDSGSGTLSGVNLWIFESAVDAEEGRTAITLSNEDDDKSWVDGRVVVSWYYPVNRDAAQAVAVDDCLDQLNG
jgi:hypothetical protein